MTLLLTYYLFLLYEYVTKISILSLYLTKLYRYVTLSFASVISHILYSEIRQNFANSAQGGLRLICVMGLVFFGNGLLRKMMTLDPMHGNALLE